MRRRLVAACAVMMIAVMAMGCAGKTPAASTDGNDTETSVQEEEPAEEEPAELSEEEEQELYNLYIGLNNTMVGRLSSSLSKYFEYVDFQEEFTLLNGEDYFCYSLESTLDELDQIDELVARKQEKSEVDDAYMALSPVIRELIQTLNEVQAYTDEDSFLEDDFAKGRELHAVLWKSCNEYEPLATEFLDSLGTVASAQRADDLDQMKEEGYVVTYALVSMITTAQEIQSAIYEQGIEDDSMMLQLDTGALQPLYDQYMEEVETVLGYLKDEEALANEGYPTQSAYYVTFEDAVENSAEELKEVFRKVEEQEEPGGYGIVNVFTVDGSLAGFNNKVSAMIDDYNRMISY